MLTTISENHAPTSGLPLPARSEVNTRARPDITTLSNKTLRAGTESTYTGPKNSLTRGMARRIPAIDKTLSSNAMLRETEAVTA
jgi:hypothetical protein